MGEVESTKTSIFYDSQLSAKESDVTAGSNKSFDESAPPTKLTSSSDSSLDLVSLLWIYSGPVIFAVGLCGNALILVVMTRRRMSGTSTSVHLSLMAIADMAVLCTGLVPEWIEAAVGIIPKEIHPITCKLEKFLFYTSGDTSIWILVIFTIDRFTAICFPLHKRDCCLPSRAKYYATGAFILAVLKNLPAFWTRGAEYKSILGQNSSILVSNCGRPTKMSYDYETFIRPWIALVTVNIIPFCVILFCNIFIIRALYQVQRMRSEQSIVSASDKSMVQMTTMCLSASFCFLICITPSIVLLIGKPYWYKSSKTAYNVAKGINNQLVYVNHSVNFFLYCVTGHRFRQVIVSLCSVGQGARRRGAHYRGYDESGGTGGADRTAFNSSEAVTMHLNSVGVTSTRPSPRLAAGVRRTMLVSSPVAGFRDVKKYRKRDSWWCEAA